MATSSEAIHQLVAAAGKAQSDVEALMALHSEDTIIVNVAGRRLLGRESFREAMTSAMNTSLADVITRVEVDDVRHLRRDTAVVSCTKYIHDEPDGPPVSEGVLTYVVVKEEGRWRIALAQTTHVVP